METQLTRFENSKSYLKSRTARLNQVMIRHVGQGLIPGLVAVVDHQDRTEVCVVGHTDFDQSVPMARDAIFRLASTTKPITAVATMILVEECKLRLDDAVERWLPELRNRRVLRKIDGPLEDTVPANRSITVRDLLTFRSGYGELGFTAPTCPLAMATRQAKLPLATFPYVGTNDQLMTELEKLPLASQPGERWLYHMSAEILGVLISRVSGQSLGSFMQERIFDPLAMKDTGFYVPPSKVNRLPVCYGTDFSNTNLVQLYSNENKGYITEQNSFQSGAGGLASTADDLLAFGKMLRNGGILNGTRLLSHATIELMATDHIPDEQKRISDFFPGFWNDHSWGLGFSIVTKRTDVANSPGRFGWDGAFGTSLWVDPKEDLVGVLMVQRRPNTLAISDSIRDFWTCAYELADE